MEIAGRKKEIALLQSILEKRDSSFLAVYGRRRIGKTYLIRQVYENNMVFECTGVLEEDMPQQLENYGNLLRRKAPQMHLPLPPKTWIEAFFLLRDYLDELKDNTKKVIFSMKFRGLKSLGLVFYPLWTVFGINTVPDVRILS